jgi:hypothetical protein
MAIILQLSVGAAKKFGKDLVSIGREASCDLSMPQDERLQARHAVIHKVAGRWLIESAGDWSIRVGTGLAGRKCWLKPGDVIHLTETGPDVTFDVVASDGVSRSSEMAAQGRIDAAPTPNVEAAPPPPPLPRESLVVQEVCSPEPGPPALAARADETPPPLPATSAMSATPLLRDDTLPEQKPFSEYAWEYYRATHGLTTWTVAVVVGMLSVPVLSFLKPVLGFRTLVAIPAILAAILAVSAMLFVLGRSIGYYLRQRRDVPHDARSWLSIIAYGSMVMLVPLTLLMIVEYFTSPHGSLVALAPTFRSDQERCIAYLTQADAGSPRLSDDNSPLRSSDSPAVSTYDFSEDDYATIPDGAVRVTNEKPLDGGTWIVEQGYRLSNGEFLAHGTATIWWDKERTEKVGEVPMFHGKQHGVARRFHRNGVLAFEIVFVKDRKHGLACDWFEDGTKSSEENWLDGVQHGSSQVWHPNGQMKVRCEYSHGTLHGPYSEWTSEGVEICHGDYRNGEPVGVWRLGYAEPFTSRWRYIEVNAGTPTVGTRSELLSKLNLWNSAMGIRVPFFDPFRCKGSGAMRSTEHFFSICGSPASDEPREPERLLAPYLRRWVYRCTDGNLELDIWISREDGSVRWATVLPE